jgi:GNAT superfamily N-acetyltransferase
MGIKILNAIDALRFTSLTFQVNRHYLLNCDRDNIIAIGAYDQDGTPCGLILAFTSIDQNKEKNSAWYLASIFVKENLRRSGIGRSLWNELKKTLEGHGCETIQFQTVMKEERLEEFIPYCVAMGFPEPDRIAKIFGFNNDAIERSPFIRGTLAEAFQPDPRFRYISFDLLTQEQRRELEANEGGWYPEFVSPLIGKEQANKKCTTFAVDNERDKIAGWITALNVNNNTRILYRSFFTREEYRDTQVGFFIFTEAVKNHLKYYRDRGGLSSIPTDNERAMRFSTLFFRNAYDHISYELEGQYQFNNRQ